MCRLFLVTCACLAVLFGTLSLVMMPKLIQQKIEQRMQLKIGTKTYERFTRVPIPITVKFYLFNISNAAEVLAGLERPQFQELGPFVYEQWRRREVVDFLDNNRKIVYREFKTFYSKWAQLVPGPEINRTSWHLPDGTTILNPNAHRVTLVNMPLMGVLSKLAHYEGHFFVRGAARQAAGRLIRESGEKILITKQANEFLFDGYKVEVLSAVENLFNTLGYNFESPLPGNKFGFFHGKNGTWTHREPGELTIFTGRNDSMNDFMLVDNWNGLKQLNVWPKNTEAGNRCNEIKGTDGSQFHPGVTRDQTLDIFSPLICTSIFVKYQEDTSTRDIPLLRFTTPPEVFSAPRKNPRNACYCTIPANSASSTPGDHQQHHGAVAGGRHHASNKMPPALAATKHRGRITDRRCYIDGLMDLSLCQRGAPVAASGAHFYNSDPMLAMAADLKPEKRLHETYLDIEPMTGAVMRAASRAQLNALVEQAYLEVLSPEIVGNMSAMVAPLLWLEESAEIDEKSSLELKSQLLNTVNKARRMFFYAIAFGCILFAVVSLQYWYATCYKIDLSSSRASSRQRRNKRNEAVTDRRRSGSRRSDNLARRPLVVTDLDKHNDKSSTGALVAASSLVAAAAVMGAADAAVANNQRRKDRERRRTRRVDYENDQDELNDHEDDEQLSKRGLVDSEWTLGGVANQSTGASSGENSSPAASTPDGYPDESPPPPNETAPL